MEEVFTLKQRIMQFAQQTQQSLDTICSRAEVGTYVLTNGNPTWDNLCKLCLANQDLSAEYIIRGEGSPVRRIPQNADTSHSVDMLTKRIDAYLHLTKTTKTELLKLADIKPDILKNRTDAKGIFHEANPTYANLQKICNVIPNFSAEYLLRGEGSPIRILDESADDDQFSDTFPSLVNEYINSRKLSTDGPTLADLLITSMQETIRTQRELINSLHNQVALLQKSTLIAPSNQDNKSNDGYSDSYNVSVTVSEEEVASSNPEMISNS